MLGLWSVLALSGTLAGEAAKGSLDLLASTPQSRRSIALQKVAGHMTALTAAMVLFAVITWVAGVAFAALPGDEIPLAAAFGQALLYGLLMLAAGSLSFAVAPFVGRTRALAFGLIALFGGYLINSYASLSPADRCAATGVVVRRGPPGTARSPGCPTGPRSGCWPW